MVLRWLRKDQAYPDSSLTPEEVTERAWMLDKIGTQSVWTADLVLLLDRLFRQHRDLQQSKYLFCSKNLDVNNGHCEIDYYREAFGNDLVRVTENFKELQRLGAATLSHCHLPTQKVVDAVSKGNCVAIVLLDNSILRAETLAGEEDVYMGHYVIISSISRDAEDLKAAQLLDDTTNVEELCLVIINPGIAKQRMLITPSRFERAWRAKGTDEDIIFIAKHSSL
jgi:hypothetical protein